MAIKDREFDSEEVRVKEAVAALARNWVPLALKGKVPRQKGWQKAPTPSQETVISWAQRGNIGIRTGSPSGIVVIDEDPQNGGDATTLNLPPTVTAVSGGKGNGKHFYFTEVPGTEIRNSTSSLGLGIDVRGEGGQIVLPGAIHPDSKLPYRWLEGHAPDEIEIAELPPEIVKRLIAAKKKPQTNTQPASNTSPKYVKAAVDRECDAVATAPKGTRNNTLNIAAFKLGTLVGSGCLDGREAASRLMAAAATHFGNEFTETEANKVITSGMEAGIKQPRTLPSSATAVAKRQRPRTEVGNAERLVDLHGQNLRYCFLFKKWFHYNGKRWLVDETGQINRMAKNTIRSISFAARQEFDAAIREAMHQWSTKSERTLAIQNMISLARSEENIPVMPGDLDTNPTLLNTLSGTVSLENGVLGPHRREDLITKQVPVRMDPRAKAPEWEQFLKRILPDPKVREYLQFALGYACTGCVREHVIHFFVGDGANGKSTLVEAIHYVLGDYALTAPSSLLMAAKGDRHPTERALLHGKRAVFFSETPEGGVLNENLIKELTGGDRITARRMREDFWEYEPTHKLFLSTNHRPRITGTDHGIWRRIRLIPFDQTIPENEQDSTLGKKLRAEAPGILNWLIEGSRRYLQEGLKAPEAIEYATAEYRAKEDDLSEFVETCLEEKKDNVVSSADIFKRYQQWSENNCIEKPLGPRSLTTRLKAHGFQDYRTATIRGFIGLGLRA